MRRQLVLHLQKPVALVGVEAINQRGWWLAVSRYRLSGPGPALGGLFIQVVGKRIWHVNVGWRPAVGRHRARDDHMMLVRGAGGRRRGVAAVL